MKDKYYRLEFVLDKAKTPRISQELIDLLIAEGEVLLEVDKGWRNQNEWTDCRDTQW